FFFFLISMKNLNLIWNRLFSSNIDFQSDQNYHSHSQQQQQQQQNHGKNHHQVKHRKSFSDLDQSLLSSSSSSSSAFKSASRERFRYSANDITRRLKSGQKIYKRVVSLALPSIGIESNEQSQDTSSSSNSSSISLDFDDRQFLSAQSLFPLRIEDSNHLLVTNIDENISNDRRNSQPIVSLEQSYQRNEGLSTIQRRCVSCCEIDDSATSKISKSFSFLSTRATSSNKSSPFKAVKSIQSFFSSSSSPSSSSSFSSKIRSSFKSVISKNQRQTIISSPQSSSTKNSSSYTVTSLSHPCQSNTESLVAPSSSHHYHQHHHHHHYSKYPNFHVTPIGLKSNIDIICEEDEEELDENNSISIGSEQNPRIEFKDINNN
ncbi:hypothetical protein SSS_09630, partial [Sarcoptes scabiei]